MDEHLGLETLIGAHLTDSRQGANAQFSLADLLRQSVYSRLAGYEDLNDAVRVSADPTFRLIGSPTRWDRGGALTSILHWFETNMLRCCTNRHWPARGQSTGSSPADAIRHRSAEGGHPIEDLTAEDDRTPLPSWAPGAKTTSDDGFVSEDHAVRQRRMGMPLRWSNDSEIRTSLSVSSPDGSDVSIGLVEA